MILILAVGSCRKAGTWLVREDGPAHADVMVMLMGNIASDRILQIADLYQENVAGEVLIVEEGSGAMGILEERGVHLISSTEQVHNALVSLGVPADSIVILPGGATSTQMEVEIIRDFLATQTGAAQTRIDTLLVVSSSPHTRRAYQIFRAAFKSLEHPVVVFCSPSPYTKFNAEKWWRDKDDIQDVIMEYLKMANFVLFEKRELRKDPH